MSSKKSDTKVDGYDINQYTDFLNLSSSLDSLLSVDVNEAAPDAMTKVKTERKTASWSGDNYNNSYTNEQLGIIEKEEGDKVLDILIPLYEQRVADYRFRKGQPGINEQTRSKGLIG